MKLKRKMSGGKIKTFSLKNLSQEAIKALNETVKMIPTKSTSEINDMLNNVYETKIKPC